MRKILPVLFVLFGSIFSAHGQSNIGKQSLIQAYLLGPESKFNLTADDLKELQITDDYKSHNAPWNYTYVRQKLNGRPIANSSAVLVIQNSRILYAKSDLIRRLSTYPTAAVPQNSASSALRILTEVTKQEVSIDQEFPDSENFEIRNTALSEEPLRFELMYLLHQGNIRLVWHINWYLKERTHWYDAYVDASDNSILELHDWVMECRFDGMEGHDHTECSFTIPSVQKDLEAHAVQSYQVFPVPVESPNHGNRQIVVNPSDVDASPYGWHDIDGVDGAEFTTTRGNNVRARDDRDNNNTGGLEVDGGSNLEFSAPFDKNQSASLYLEAAIINLFYWNNIMHDVWYHYGFDEPAGNFQENNYNKGGIGSDYVNADAQDGSGSNNANFATPPDGQNPRMQMFLWQASSGNNNYFQVNSPASVAGKYTSVQSAFGPRLNAIPVTGKLVLVNDGSSAPTEACQPIQNAAEVNGNIALIDRGDCQFVEKIGYAQSAGARAVVMVNNVAGSPIPMGGSSAGITIPAVMITMNDGQTLKDLLLTQSINVSLYDSTGGGVSVLDSDFDNGVIAHEYTHGISIRLTGGPSQNCLTGNEQMGEGWSDFLALVMTHAPGASATDKRGIGTYVTNETTDGGGIRPYPYSTSRSINPVTYDYIKLPQFTVPHGVGSVWCSMLWDLYWAFTDKYGYDSDLYRGTGGNNMVMHLVMDGLKLQGCNPGFIDGRDAILAADRLRYSGANQQLIWEVFAGRGLGYSASQGSSTSKTDGVEAFDLPPFVFGYDFHKTGPDRAKAGDTIVYSLKIRNLGEDVLSEIVVYDTLAPQLEFISSDATCPATSSGSALKFTLSDIVNGDSLTCTYRVRIKPGIGGESVWMDDVETDEGNFTKTVATGGGTWIRLRNNARSGEYAWYINNPSSASDRALLTDIDLDTLSEPHFVFYHKYETEDLWDGAVVEIGDGNSWTDLGPFMIENGYNARIQTNPASAISDRNAFTGISEGYIRTVIDLTPYAGTSQKLRFRFVSDGLAGATGWYLDDFELWDDFLSVENRALSSIKGLEDIQSKTGTIISYQVGDTTDPGDTTVIVLPDTSEVLTFYPNPLRNSDLNVRFTSKVSKSANLQLYDLSGKYLWEGIIRSNQPGSVPLYGRATGIYLLRIKTDDAERIERIYLIH